MLRSGTNPIKLEYLFILHISFKTIRIWDKGIRNDDMSVNNMLIFISGNQNLFLVINVPRIHSIQFIHKMFNLMFQTLHKITQN